jgi:hypothetical protein
MTMLSSSSRLILSKNTWRRPKTLLTRSKRILNFSLNSKSTNSTSKDVS